MMQPRSIQTQEINIVGVGVKTNNIQEADSATAQVPLAWERFSADKIASQVLNPLMPERPLGVYSYHEHEYNGNYEFVVGLEVEDLTQIPEGLTGVKIPPGEYVIFSVQGKIPNIVVYTWNYIKQYFINNTTYERAYKIDFELYKPEDQIDLYVSVREKVNN
jgi:predicted transcriptional regulator YdeE